MKRVFIVHGWGSSPKEDWFPWLTKELKKRGFRTKALKMPDTDHPKITPWVAALDKAVGTPDADTYFVAHSIGCQTTMRYLQRIKKEVGGMVLVGAWFTLKGLEAKEKPIAKPWLTTKINTSHVKKIAKKTTVILSDDDPVVPYNANRKAFKTRLDAKIVTLRKKGHIDGNTGITELPIALQELTKIAA